MSDFVYYERRARDERDAAEGAASAQARQLHLELAAAYEGRMSQIAAKDRRSTMHLIRAA